MEAGETMTGDSLFTTAQQTGGDSGPLTPGGNVDNGDRPGPSLTEEEAALSRQQDDLLFGPDRTLPEPEPVAAVLERPAHDNSLWTDGGPQMAKIWRWAMYGMVSPWALLACILARVAAEAPWLHRLPGPRGDNYRHSTGGLFHILLANSGIGKSGAKDLSQECLDILGGRLPAANRWATMKTAEGLLRFYMTEIQLVDDDGEDAGKEWRQTMFQALCYADEFAALVKIGGRGGNYLTEALSSAYTGHFDARTTLTKPIPAPAPKSHLSLVAGTQEAVIVDTLFGKAALQGWTERLTLFDAAHPDRTHPSDTDAEPPSPIRVELPNCGQCGNCSNTVAKNQTHLATTTHRIRTEILERLYTNLTGQTSGHTSLIQLRLANAVALLNERWEIHDEDWDIAALIIAHSDRLIKMLEDHLPDHVRKSNRPDLTYAVIRQNEIRTQPRHATAICERVACYLYDQSSSNFLRQDINRALNGRDNKILRLNSEESATDQIIRWMAHQQLVWWDGWKEGRLPARGERIIWAQSPYQKGDQ